MRDIVLIHSTISQEIPTLCVSEIHYLPIYDALLESNIPPHAPQECIDALIFTSKHAVFSLMQAMAKRKELSAFAKIPAFAIGEKCAQALTQAGFAVEFVSSTSHGESFAREIIERANGRKMLYFRAKDIASNLDLLLTQAQIPLAQITAYTKQPKPLSQSLKPRPQSVLIFTAPSHYHFFVQNFGWDPSYIAVAIGQTTLRAFAPSTICYASPTQSLESCIDLAKILAQRAQNHTAAQSSPKKLK